MLELDPISYISNFWKTVGGIIGGGIGLLFLIIVMIVVMVVTYIRKRKRRQRQQQLQVMVIEGVEPIQHDDPENDHDQEHDSLIKKDSKEITEDAIEKGIYAVTLFEKQCQMHI